MQRQSYSETLAYILDAGDRIHRTCRTSGPNKSGINNVNKMAIDFQVKNKCQFRIRPESLPFAREDDYL